MPAVSKPRTAIPPLTWLLLTLSLCIAALWFVHALGYWEDDAYIHLEFARSVASGRGFSFNGHIVYGDTSPLWVFLLVAFHSLIPDWIAAGKTLTAVAAVFTLTGAFFFANSLVRKTLSPAASSLFAATMVLVFVSNPYFGYWAFSGMEALAAAGLVCWGLFAIAPRQLSPLRFLIACILAGLAPVLRPEMSFFTLLMGLLLLQRLYRMGAPEALALPRKLLLLCAGLFFIAAPALLWARYALHTFGMVVPNTNAAKRAPAGDSVAAHLLQVYTFGFPVIVLALLALAAWLLWYLLRGRSENTAALPLSPATWLLLIWTAINCVFYCVDHTYVQTRYIFVTAPVLTIALLAVIAQHWRSLYRGLVLFALLFGLAVGTLSTWPLVRNKVQVDRIYADLASFLRTLPPDAPVAHYSIGEAGFLSQHPLIDTGGITRPGILPFLNDPTDTRRTAWIYSQGAAYEIIDHAPVPGAQLVWSRDMPQTSWAIHLHPNKDLDHLMVWKLPPTQP
jgi:hypothetical protein